MRPPMALRPWNGIVHVVNPGLVHGRSSHEDVHAVVEVMLCVANCHDVRISAGVALYANSPELTDEDRDGGIEILTVVADHRGEIRLILGLSAMGIGIRFALMHDDELDTANALRLCDRLAIERGRIIVVRWIAVRPLRVKVRAAFGRRHECDGEIECLQERIGEGRNHRSADIVVAMTSLSLSTAPGGTFIVVGIGQVLPSSGIAVIHRQIGSCDCKGWLAVARPCSIGRCRG